MSALSESQTVGLRVLVADEDHEALDRLASMLDELGHEVTARAVSVRELSREINETHPDVAIVKLHGDEDHALDLIDELVEEAECAVLALMEVEKPEFVATAAEKGLFGFVAPATPEAIQSEIEVTVRRHGELRRLSDEVEQLETALARRAIIERAKGILMERHGVDEKEAFQMLRDHARSSNLKLIDVARSVATGHKLLSR
ncbi:MAG TPA: ANTAR domain-containing protein [Thermoleophilaceae bacterium]